MILFRPVVCVHLRLHIHVFHMKQQSPFSAVLTRPLLEQSSPQHHDFFSGKRVGKMRLLYE